LNAVMSTLVFISAKKRRLISGGVPNVPIVLKLKLIKEEQTVVFSGHDNPRFCSSCRSEAQTTAAKRAVGERI
jgi:hypothetical protein